MTMKLLAGLPRRFQALMAPIMDTADAAFAVSLDCQILAWGTRAQQLFGFAPLEILGRYCYDTLPAHDAAGQCLCSVNCPMVVAARTAVLVVASDVTRYKQTEQLVRGIVSRIDAEPVSEWSGRIAPMRPASDDTDHASNMLP